MGWRFAAVMEWLFAHIGVPMLRVIAPLFFRREYLAGRHFGVNGDGWRWVSRSILTQRILRYNRTIPWPVSPFILVGDWRKIHFYADDLNNFQTTGCYFQTFGHIWIGEGTYIAPNTGFITANHDPLNPERHLPSADIRLGKACWIGMNAVVMPGVTLGDHTVVGAGAVVTRSYPEGFVVLAGVPARPLRRLNDDRTAIDDTTELL